ncbi:phosphatidylinositol N-acetylglucosaminyltransferase subunit P isoform X1 [Schistocerca americana]|uniref:phosphatidylinositol N-acetylglucosaminyltransferase subunit P n=1 Tax=Schistocerca serialis cubense TaxID=2023355 RepID=UPI001F4F8BFE|nr:phosphatidylinositol N-acetylglucosaminyltransferase subunit P isoform X1 [Schistocerca americana]XP_049944524.1 phosphatidylinositol N-acetylglucosaminyltransferase subunit P [Schistocerca serialis cubense]
MPEHTPAPTPARAVYGFVLYLASVTSAALFLLWAYVPPDVASSLGLSYLPQRYWAVALPVHLCVGLALFAFFFYPGLGLAMTPALSDPQTVGDGRGRGTRNAAPAPAPGAVPPVGDLHVSEVCRHLYLGGQSG